MEAIVVADLKETALSPVITSFSDDMDDARQLKDIIDNFSIESNGSIQGKMWDKIQSKLSLYSEALQVRIDSANILSEAINKALKILIDYIGDEYDSLDYTLLPDIEAQYEQAKANYYMSCSQLDEDSDNNYKGLMNGYKQQMDELDSKIEKLRILKEKYEEAESIITSAMASVNSKIVSINDIIPSSKVYFKTYNI